MKIKNVVVSSALMLASQLVMASQPERIVSFDYGSLDTLTELGLADQVVAVPKQTLPHYLAAYNTDQYVDVGNAKNIDITAAGTAKPTLIMISGRQQSHEAELKKLAKVENMSFDTKDYWKNFSAQVEQIGKQFGVENKAKTALASLHSKIDALKAKVGPNKHFVLVIHNNGHLMMGNYPVVDQVMGLQPSPIPAGVETKKRGNRSFTPLTPANIVTMNPDVLYIVDRSAAINKPEEALDLAAFKQTLAKLGGGDIKVSNLNPGLWYISGNGLESVYLQAKEVANAF
ncbi:MAG: ABC transporter substrate-binding protein [Marinomonas sp.]|uniref:ABC transporter substrate-binding protein n=1 Tax=Marinomonas sp. TaxID=1904862 RepID=UPI003C76DE75